MGEAAEKLSGKLGIDTTDFKTGIREADREMRRLESGFKASASSLGDWTKSASGLELRVKSLTEKLDVQRLKVAALRENFERIKQEQGENSKAAKEAEIALNKQVETLGKMENELQQSEQALNELSTAEESAGENAEEATGKVDRFGNVVSGIGTVIKGTITVVAGLALAVAGVTTAIGGMVLSSAAAADELDDLSKKTSISTERLQELDYAGAQIGTTQDTIVGAMSKMIRAVSSAGDQFEDYNRKQAEASAKGQEFNGELGAQAEAFQSLGVNIYDASGRLRDSEEIFADALDALGQISNATERDAIAMQIFGKSAQELNPLIIAGADELARLSAEAHEMGAVVSGENVSALAELNDQLTGLKMGLQGTVSTLAAAFVPGVSALFTQAGGYVKEFASIVSGADGDFGKIATGLGGLVTTIITDISAQAPQLMQTGLTILMSIVDAILTNLPMMISTGVELLLTLINGLVEALPALVDAALQAIITLANGLTQALPTLIPTIVGVILQIVMTLLENLPMIIDAALQLILALASGLIAALPVLLPMIPKIVEAIFNALVQAYPMLLIAAMELIKMLVFGIRDNFPVLFDAVVQLIKVLFNWMISDMPKMFQTAGKALITGIWQGIKENMQWLKDNFVSSIMSMVDSVKNALGIHSPADYLADEVGEHMPTGIGKGFDKSMPKVRQHLVRSMLGLADDVSTAAAPQIGVAGAGGVGGGSVVSIGDIIINIPGTNATPQQIAVAAQDGVLKALRAKGS
jgi:hypothetical protein